MPKVIDLPTTSAIDNGDYLIMEESTGGTKKITRSNMLGATLNDLGLNIFPQLAITAGSSKTLNLRNVTFNSALILGTLGGYGSVVLAATLQNGTVAIRNLITNTAWSNSILTISQSGTTITINNGGSAAHYISVYTG